MLWLLAALALGAPLELEHQGRLSDAAGDPLEGPETLHFALYGAAQGGTALWTESHDVDLAGGFYSVALGTASPLDASWFDDGPLFLGLAIGMGAELPRQEIHSVPYAIRAAVARAVSGGEVDASSVRVGGQLVIDANGRFVGQIASATLGGLTCSTGQVPVYGGSSWGCASRDAVPWSAITGLPGDLADGHVTWAELQAVPTDLSDGHVAWDELLDVPTDLADGFVSWDELTSKPAPLADGAVSWDELTGKPATLADGAVAFSELQSVPADLADGKIGWSELQGVPTALADGAVAFSELQGVPLDLQDGDDVLTEQQVEDYVTNDPLDLAVGTTVGGDALVTASQTCAVGLVVTGIDVNGTLSCDASASQNTTVAKTASYTILAAEAQGGVTFTNQGAAGTVTFTLPPAVAGMKVTILRTANQNVRIVPSAGDDLGGDAVYELPVTYTGTTLYAVSASRWVQGDGRAVPELSDLKAGLTFTPCGATGRFGPSTGQCATAYAAIPRIRDNLSVQSGIQVWTVPVTGTYRIEAWGAEGGGRIYSGAHCTGGLGGYAAGEIALTAGQQIKVVVGQKGGSVDDSTTRGQGDGQGLNGSGGGGSFVTTIDNVPLIVAGGGGGRHPDQSGCTDVTIHGGTTVYTTEGGGAQQDDDSGAGGGGLSSNGSGNWGEQHNNDPGRSLVNGGRGGEANEGQVGGCCGYTYYTTIDAASGGFGGGGGARYWSSSAGGGGYHGGKGWNTVTTTPTWSGGSSFVSGANTAQTAGIRTGSGQVVITLK